MAKSNILFPRIGIMGRYRRILPQDTVQAIINFLKPLTEVVIVEADTAKLLSIQYDNILPRAELAEAVDLILVVGGDGSLLGAAKTAITTNIPVVGVNRGTLGFLTDIHPEHFEANLLEILSGQYIKEQRMLIQAELFDANHQKMHSFIALNDVVLSLGVIPHLVEFATYIDNRFVCQQRADGLIITTPTGSTAYALSAGGSILDPELDIMALVPMFPHKLSSRPIVVAGESEIKLEIATNNDGDPTLSADGQERVTMPRGGSIVIKRLDKKLQLLHPLSYDYYETLRNKLGWETL